MAMPVFVDGRKFKAIIKHETNGDGYIAHVEEFPGCEVHAETIVRILDSVRSAISDLLQAGAA
jgi:predicted RNase H-like HicB family nuclease